MASMSAAKNKRQTRAAAAGGLARARALNPAARAEIARAAAAARWGKKAPRLWTLADLRAARQGAGMSQREVASRLGWTRSSYATLEQGRYPLIAGNRSRLAAILPALTRR